MRSAQTTAEAVQQSTISAVILQALRLFIQFKQSNFYSYFTMGLYTSQNNSVHYSNCAVIQLYSSAFTSFTMQLLNTLCLLFHDHLLRNVLTFAISYKCMQFLVYKFGNVTSNSVFRHCTLVWISLSCAILIITSAVKSIFANKLKHTVRLKSVIHFCPGELASPSTSHASYDKISPTDPSPITRSRSIDKYNRCRVHTTEWLHLCRDLLRAVPYSESADWTLSSLRIFTSLYSQLWCTESLSLPENNLFIRNIFAIKSFYRLKITSQ